MLSVLSPIIYTPKCGLCFIAAVCDQVFPTRSTSRLALRLPKNLQCSALGRPTIYNSTHGRFIGSRGADASSQAATASTDDREERRYLQALLLCFFASQNRSLVATRFLVETLLEMYVEGFTLADMEVRLSMARLESGGALLEAIEQEVLLSWCAMVMLTLETVGLPRRPASEGRRERREREQKGRMELGMQGFVAQTIDMYRGGFDARRMLLQQSLAQEEDGAISQGTKFMQQNTRLIILTLEVLRECGLATDMLLSPSVLTAAAGEESVASIDSDDEASTDRSIPSKAESEMEAAGVDQTASSSKSSSESRDGGSRESKEGSVEDLPSASQTVQDPTPPVEYIFDFLPDQRKAEVLANASSAGGSLRVRSAALHLLMAFVGAHLQSLYAVQAFIQKAYICYREGYTVQELYDQVAPEEVVHGTSGALPVAADSAASSHRANKQLFGQWISIVYMTFAQLGAAREGGTASQEGWASIETPEGSDQGVIEAYRLADLVQNTLRIETDAEEGADSGAEQRKSAAEAAFLEHFGSEEVSKLVQKQVEEGVSLVVMEDPSLRQSSPALTMLSHFTGLVKLARDLFRRQQQQTAEQAKMTSSE